MKKKKIKKKPVISTKAKREAEEKRKEREGCDCFFRRSNSFSRIEQKETGD